MLLTKEQKQERLTKIPKTTPTVYRKLVCSYLSGNNNKWWSVKYWDKEDIILIEFARVGENCSSPQVLLGGDDYPAGHGLAFLNKKASKKLAEKDESGHYTEIKLAEEAIETEYQGVTEPNLKKRLDRIFQAANESINSTLLGRIDELSLAQIEDARQVLADISNQCQGINLSQASGFITSNILPVAQRYYNLIPTDLGRKIDPFGVAYNLAMKVADEEDRLQQLKAALEGSKIKKSGGSLLDQLGSHMAWLPHTDEGYLKVKEFISTTSRADLSKLEVYEVVIHSNKAQYDKEQRGASKIQFLCHGTKKQYVRHILRSGLIVPDSGYSRLFGYGIYFADCASKSLSYMDNGYDKYMFLNEVKVGRQHIARSGNSWRARDLPKDVDSLYAPGAVPIQGAHNGSLTWSEYVVYYASQQTAKYLAVF